MGAIRGFVVVVAIVALAGCSSSGPTSHTSGPAGHDSSAANAPVGKSGVAVGKPVAVCQALPATAVAKIVGEPITTAKEVDVPNLKTYECDYDTADGDYGLSLHVLAQDGKSNFDADVQGAATKRSVPGLGDQAAITTAGLDALFGDVLIRAAVPGPTEVSVKLIRALHDAM